MKILVIGKGGREHAIAWKCHTSIYWPKVYVAPGNSGMSFAQLVDIKETDVKGLVEFAKKEEINLTIVGGETPIECGVVDAFEKEGLRIFGPTKTAAKIETSKEYAKHIMNKYNIPTAKWCAFDDYDKALKYLEESKLPIVIKYDGLALGKGVVVAISKLEAIHALRTMLVDKIYGDAKVIIEEYLEGVEFTFMSFVNNEIVLPLELAQDFKRAYDGDSGPNTGGMGAYSPVVAIGRDIIKFSYEHILKRVAKALVKENVPFKGVLYGGLMLTKDGVKVIEFNARFGDPETEVVLPRMKSDLVWVINKLLDGEENKIEWYDEKVFGVVLASNGYPSEYQVGYPIEGIEGLVFHMGTKFENGKYYTNGGRVLLVVQGGKTYKDASENVYKLVKKIKCSNLYYRKDIGHSIKE